MDQLQRCESCGLMRLPSIIRPDGLVPCGRSTWWAGVQSGRFPPSVRCGRLTFWRKADIHELIELISRGLDWSDRVGGGQE